MCTFINWNITLLLNAIIDAVLILISSCILLSDGLKYNWGTAIAAAAVILESIRKEYTRRYEDKDSIDNGIKQ
jgi:hypothetical protein